MRANDTNKIIMKTLNKNKKKNFGFTIIEVLVACSIISISMFALMQTAGQGIILSNQALKKSQASLLLEEGAEAVKSIRDNNWTTISDLSLNTNYYLSFSSSPNGWVLSTTPLTIDSIFTRTIVITSVNRDTNDDIVLSGGILDVRTKKVIINVSWEQATTTNTKSLSFYIADIFNPVKI